MSARRGFSLIEMMIVVAIIGILASLAYPGYRSYVVRSNRADAQQTLQQYSLRAERYFIQRNTYDGLTDFIASLKPVEGSGEWRIHGIYDFAAAVPTTCAGEGAGTFSYSISATPLTGKSNEGDGALTLCSDGMKVWQGHEGWSDR